MKKILLMVIIIFMVASGLVFAEESKEVIGKADQLIKDKQYNSAFKLLGDADPKEENPEIVLKQVEIALNYFGVSTMHQMFGFRDLGPGEIIEDIRGKEGVYSYYRLEINKVLEPLIAKYPKNWKLYKALGDFYYEVYVKYGNRWFVKEDELLALVEKNYTLAYQHGEFDGKSVYAMGYCQLQQKKYDQAIQYILESLKIIPENADANYNLAYAYLQKGDLDNARKYAEVSMKNYQDEVLKADAARIVAITYREQQNDPKAVEYYKISASLDPGSDYTYIGLMELLVKAKDLAAAADYADKLFALKPTAPRLTDEILRIYFEGGTQEEFLAFFKRMTAKYQKEDEILGNLNFYKAVYYREEENKKEEKRALLEANKYFRKCFKPDHYVFKIIDKRLKEL